MNQRAVLAGCSVLVAVVVASCGVPLQASPEAIPASALPQPMTTSASPSESPSPTVEPNNSLRLWFVQDDGLVAVPSSLSATSSEAEILQGLADGPGEAAEAAGLRTVDRDPLTGEPLVLPSPSEDPTVGPIDVFTPIAVVITPAFSELPSGEQVLLLAQVVLSLTGAGAPSVVFIDQTGAAVAVPLPDGRLLDEPAQARDYSSLIIRP